MLSDNDANLYGNQSLGWNFHFLVFVLQYFFNPIRSPYTCTSVGRNKLYSCLLSVSTRLINFIVYFILRFFHLHNEQLCSCEEFFDQNNINNSISSLILVYDQKKLQTVLESLKDWKPIQYIFLLILVVSNILVLFINLGRYWNLWKTK